MMNNFSKTFTLLPHTPMIHFQADQPGAVLRGSDVKPSIDRYIWHQLKRKNPDLWEEYADWIEPVYFSRPSKKKQYASGYSIRISGKPHRYFVPTAYLKNQNKGPVERALNDLYGLTLRNPNIKTLAGTPYFANVDKIKDEKWAQVRLAVMYQPLQLTIFSKYPKVSELVSKVLPQVFASQNFGTRSSKGFGCFTVQQDGLAAVKHHAAYTVEVPVPAWPDENSFEKLFAQINLLYNVLRSGINIPKGTGRQQTDSRFYCKSILFKYYKKFNTQWDKKSIKEKYYSGKVSYQKRQSWTSNDPDFPINYTNPNEKLVRDLMGLASTQSWGKTYDDATVSKHGLVKKDEAELIQRFASPLWFKPIRSSDKKSFTVYIGYNPIPAEYLGQQFEIRNSKFPGNPLPLDIPNSFTIGKYLDFAFNLDLSTHIENRFHTTDEYKQLSAIFKSYKKIP